MRINISTEELTDGCDAIVVLANEADRCVVLDAKDATSQRFLLPNWTDSDDYEKVLRNGVDTILNCCLKEHLSRVLFDLSLADDATSLLLNIILEEITDVLEAQDEYNVWVDLYVPFFMSRNADLVERFKEQLLPRNIVELHSFGDAGDDLQDRFEDFIKGFEKEKSFKELLLEKIEEKGYQKNSIFYKKAGVSCSTFSKTTSFIKNQIPNKRTIAALALALRLDIDGAQEFYNSAGYYLGKNAFVDQIIRFFIKEKIYDINEVNYCMLYYGLPILGSTVRGDNAMQ